LSATESFVQADPYRDDQNREENAWSDDQKQYQSEIQIPVYEKKTFFITADLIYRHFDNLILTLGDIDFYRLLHPLPFFLDHQMISFSFSLLMSPKTYKDDLANNWKFYFILFRF
jgi:hypothetical protein